MQVIDINGNICAKTTGGSVAWGTITGTLSSQTDLQTALNAKQNTLVSGTNIKTINSTSLLGSGDIVIGGGGLTVGTTAIASGTDTRLLYQSAGVLSQSANLTFTATNKLNINNGAGIISIYHDTFGGLVNVPSGKGYLYLQSESDDIYIDTGAAKKMHFRQGASTYSNFTSTGLSIGYGTTTAAAKLDVRAQGALSTDIVQRWRNSADSANLAKITGDGAATFGTYTNPTTRLSVTGNAGLGLYCTGQGTGAYFQNETGTGTAYAAQFLGRQYGSGSPSGYNAYGILTGADTSNGINYGLRSYAYNGTTNYAGYFDATGGTNNYALVTQRGFSGFNKIDPSAIVDIKAAGALSTDIAFRVRNSADTTDILKVQGDAGIVYNGRIGLNTATNAGIDLFITAGSASSYGIYAIGTYGVAAISARPDTATTNYNFHASACARFGAYYASNTGGGTTVTGIRIGYVAESFNANAFDNIGFKCDIANTGGGGAIALDIVNGNFRFGTATGTKIATATTQKIGFWNATPIVQPTTAVTPATVVSGSGGNVKHDDTFDGYTVEQVVRALRNTGILA